MDKIIIVIAIITFIYSFFTLVEFLIGFSLIKNLSKQIVLDKSSLPSVSIIFSALDEEADIEAAVMSLLNIDYPNFEIIAINDRSQDKTPIILDKLQKQFPQLHVHHISSLPNGWFGKNHALYYGSQHAKGDWLLFTDADVHMKSDTISKAMSYVLEKDLQHLTICEHHTHSTFWLKILLSAYYLTYCISFKPWRIRYRWSKKSLGHGAFNLVNKNAYQQSGTHKAIPFECLDDLKLGELIKKNGYKQDTVDGRDFVQREWYISLHDMIEGWKKNTFSYFEYRLSILILSSLSALGFFIWPLFAVFICQGSARWLNGLNIILMLIISTYVCKKFRMQLRYAIFYPVSILLLIYSIWNSVFTIYRQKGVVWRGTHYSLKQIKTHKFSLDK